MKQTTRTWTNNERQTIFSQSWLPDSDAASVKDVVVLIHGLGEHSDRYAPWAMRFVDKGVAVHALDLRGHGRSGGKRGHTPSMGAIYDDVKNLMAKCRIDHPGARLHLYGHSMGGAVAIGYITLRNGDAQSAGVTSVTLSGPAFRPGFEPPAWKIKLAGILESIWPSLTLPNGLDPEWLSSNQAVVAAYKADPLVHNMISVRWYNDWTRSIAAVENSGSGVKIPVLVMHGGDDRATSPSAAEKAALAMGARFKAFPGMRHEIHHEPCADEVFQMTLDFIRST